MSLVRQRLIFIQLLKSVFMIAKCEKNLSDNNCDIYINLI